MIALVRGVIAAATAAGSMFWSSRTSANTGLAPAATIAAVEATNEFGGVMNHAQDRIDEEEGWGVQRAASDSTGPSPTSRSVAALMATLMGIQPPWQRQI